MQELEQTAHLFCPSSLYQKVIFGLFSQMRKGRLEVTLPSGEKRVFGNDPSGPQAKMHIYSDALFKRCIFFADLGLAESYCEGEWHTDRLDLVFEWFIVNKDSLGVLSGGKKRITPVNFLGAINKILHFRKKNTVLQGEKNIHYHYDLSNEFFQEMLDPTMAYSCGIFPTAQTSLHEAQLLKFQKICDSLELKSTDTLLEVGSGWGGFAFYAAQKYKLRVHSITISKKQLEYATKKCLELGLQDLVTFEYRDYRTLKNVQYDKIVSIEMIEAVGDAYLPQYFRVLSECLKPQGILLIQAITSPDARYEEFKDQVDFIQKHIFPGSLLPSVARMVESAHTVSDLQLYRLEDIGMHYVQTLKHWLVNFEKSLPQFEVELGNVFIRKWRYYLYYCIAAFGTRNISDVQVTFVRPNNIQLR